MNTPDTPPLITCSKRRSSPAWSSWLRALSGVIRGGMMPCNLRAAESFRLDTSGTISEKETYDKERQLRRATQRFGKDQRASPYCPRGALGCLTREPVSTLFLLRIFYFVPVNSNE